MSGSRTRPARASTPDTALTARLGAFRTIAERLRGPVVVTDARGDAVWANPSFLALAEYDLEEIVGQSPGRLLQGPDTSAETIAQMGAAFAAGRPFDATVLNYARSGRQYWVRIEAQPLFDDSGRVEGFVAVQGDVTEQLVAQAREETLSRIAEGLLPCTTIEAAARVVADVLASTADVRAAQVWLVEPGSEHLRYLHGAAADESASEWIAIGASLPFARGTEWIVGVGAPGVAWGTGRPCAKTDFWVPDHTGHFSRRARAAQRARIRTVCAVPVVGPDGVLAVLEIGGSHRFPGHERLPSLVERVAQQFASFLLRHQSQQAFEAIFRRSPDALLLLDERGAVTRCNARALELFGPALPGRPIEALLDDAEALLEEASARTEGTSILERRGHRPGGETFAADVTAAAATAAGGRVTIVAVRDLTERRAAEEAVRRSLDEKVVLVQEVHHRVKNNLQVLTGLLALQSSGSEDAPVRAALDEATHRIRSMALVHQLLYDGDDLAHISLRDYLVRLCDTLRASFAPDAEIRVEAAPVALPLERAIPCGLLTNELLTNAFKHGRSEDGRCRIEAKVETTATGFALEISDRGPGMKGGSSPGSMGQTLIAALVRQLRGRLRVTTEGGTTIRVEIDDRPALTARRAD